MSNEKGFSRKKLSFARKVVIASTAVTGEKNTIHSFSEVDISTPKRLFAEYAESSSNKISFTGYIVTCLGRTVSRHPHLNAFISSGSMIKLDDVTINVLFEKEIDGEKVPDSIGISNCAEKKLLEIHSEIRDAQKKTGEHLGSLSGSTWVRFIPGFLLKTFIRIADRSVRMGRKFGKIAVTSVGMFSSEQVWFLPHGTATVLVTVGSIADKVIEVDGRFESRPHLCLTVSFDHDIVDGAPASRFMNDFLSEIKSGRLIIEAMN